MIERLKLYNRAHKTDKKESHLPVGAVWTTFAFLKSFSGMDREMVRIDPKLVPNHAVGNAIEGSKPNRATKEEYK